MRTGRERSGVRELDITLELVPGSEPIRGNVRGATATRSFTGWMQLITALQAAIQEDQRQLGEPGGGAHTSPYPGDTAEDSHVARNDDT